MSEPERPAPAPHIAAHLVTPDPWTRLAALTPSRLALGRAGSGLPTREVLKLALAHALARDAVHAAASFETLAQWCGRAGLDSLEIESAAASREVYLRRPDYGRRLSERSRTLLGERAGPPCDLSIVVGDGLSATALWQNAEALLDALLPALRSMQVRMAPVCLARGARVALGDEVGALLGARLVIVLIGERPGLSAADSLGAYLTYEPRLGRTDAERNCVSNIRPAGLAPPEAAAKIAWLIERALTLSLTGVGLKDESDQRLVGAALQQLAQT